MAKKKKAKKAQRKKASPRPKTATRGPAKASKRPAKKKTPRATGRAGKGRKAPPSKRKKATGKAASRSSKTAVRPARKVAARGGRVRRADRGRDFYDHFRQRLLDERQQIERRLGELREELRGLEETPRELEEWAQEEKDRDILIRLEERETDELRRIQSALALIDSKEYGKCQVCGKPIPRARLEELPTAFRCIDHTP